MRTFFITFFSFLFISININAQKKKKKSMALHPERLSIGMTRKDVIIAMGEHIPFKIIGAKTYPNGTVEVGEYSDRKLVFGRGIVEEQYYLYFLNDSLVQWGRPQDWQREADRIYEIKIR